MKYKTKFIWSFVGVLGILIMGLALTLPPNKKGHAMNISLRNFKANGLATSDVSIVDESNPAFEGLFTALVSAPKEIEKDVRRFSVFISNNSGHAIAAYVVKWEFQQPNGKVISNSRSFFQSSTSPLLPSGSNRLMSLIKGIEIYQGIVRPITTIPEIPEDKRLIAKAGLNNEIDQLNKRLTESVSWSATLDGVLFVDGTFVGPNTLGYFEELKAKFDGRHDMLQEFSDIIVRGSVNPAQAQADAFRHAEEVLGSGVPRLLKFDAGEFYNRSKAQMAQEILARRDKLSVQQAIDFAKNELSKPRMQVVKR